MTPKIGAVEALRSSGARGVGSEEDPTLSLANMTPSGQQHSPAPSETAGEASAMPCSIGRSCGRVPVTLSGPSSPSRPRIQGTWPPHERWPSAVGMEPRLVLAEPTARSGSPAPHPRSTGRWSAGFVNPKSVEGAPLMGGRNRQLTAAMAAPRMAAETVAIGSPLEVAASTPPAGKKAN